jgi:O-acetylhomoserine (thiol)-lyase
VRRGDHIVSSSRLYGGTYNQFNYTLPRMGIDVTFVDPTDPANFEKAIRPNTKIIYGETLGNPDIKVFPFEEVAAIAKAYNIPLMIDNTFATPYLCRPFEWGATSSPTAPPSSWAGHGQAIGGVIVDGGNFDWRAAASPTSPRPTPAITAEVRRPGRHGAAALCHQGARAGSARHGRVARRPSTVGTRSPASKR